MQTKCSHITVVIHVSLLKKLLRYLNELGVTNLYSSFGRYAVLNESRGFTALLRTSDIINEPVEVLYFYIPTEIEALVMKSIVKVCRLDMPGRGSIFSRHVELHNGVIQDILSHIHEDKVLPSSDLLTTTLYGNLVQIHCTMSKGLIDEVAKFLLHIGVVPTITNASGTGLRDQLGLLRIFIPRDKELLSIVVGNQEANSIMEKMISVGKLDRPGRGFIWQVPVEKGVINFKTSQKAIGQAASPEQIISAIDSLKGSFSWRQGNSALSRRIKREYFKGTEFLMQVKEGASVAISREMIKLGISGATVQSLRTLSAEKHDENIVIPQEMVRVVVSEEQAKKVLEFASLSEEENHDKVLRNLFFSKVTRAFNYRAPKS